MLFNYKHILTNLLICLGFWTLASQSFALPSGGGHPHTFSLNKAILCIGDTLKVQDTCVHDPFQPISRLWSFSPGSNNPVILNQTQASIVFTTPGIKTVTLSVYDIFNVAYTDTVQILIRGAIADAGATKKYCNNSTGVFIGTADTTSANLNWTDATGSYIGSTRIINVAPNQTCYYFLTVTKDGCVTKDSVLVQKVFAPVVNAGSNATICNGAPVIIGTTAQSNFSYLWFPSLGLSDTSIAQPLANPSLNTIYTLYVTDTNKCTGNAQITVNVVSNLVASPGNNVSICLGDSIKLGNSKKSGWTYTWTPSFGLNSDTLAQPLAFPQNTTTYQLMVSAFGCTDSKSVVVTVKSLPLVDLQGRHLYHNCFGDSISVGGNTIAGYHYRWTPGTALNNQFTATTTVFPTYDTWYTLEVVGTNGCKNKDSLFIDIYDSIKAYAGLDQSICLGNSIILGAQLQVASGGSGNYIYKWLPNQTLTNPSFAHPIAQPAASTQYILTVQDASNTKCGFATDTANINIFPLPNFQLPFKKVFCKGDTPINLTAIPSGGQFSLVINNNLIPLNNNQFNPNDTAINAGVPYLIRYQYTSPQGCSYDTAVAVIVKNKPTANAGPDILYCPARGHYAKQLLGFGTGTPHWISASNVNYDTIYNPTVTNLISQSFVLQVDNGACTAQDTTLFIVCPDTVTLIANYDYLFTKMNISASIAIETNDSSSINKYDHCNFSLQLTCKNGLAYIHPTKQNIEFTYTPNHNFTGNDTAIYVFQDTLDLRVYNDTAMILIRVAPDAANDTINTNQGSLTCKDSIFNVTLNDHYASNAMPTISIVKNGMNVSCTVQGLSIYFQTKSPTFTDSFEYALTQNGVSDTATVYINYNCPNCHCQIPEGFSPNNDGKNDYLELINTNNCIPDCALIIYNRWGNVVYRTEHYDTKWDGKYNGVDLPDGTYFYIINSSENNNGGKTTGYLILQR